ncbi:DUF5916 domain-containing protein [Pseudoalteromonas sp. NC201]|uniref:DUF5916 domain-containing protein n=1 Tax=Pseudoalteromonas sp. NC201 TaxID=1514074 RepID=UPI000C7A10DF|nr:DUF5916 domain-containing protein [Pseudoalteromonas sp. NC201]AUJ69406.1 hypothetical protein PNC201_05465 [Pseudoalteromonas sp. NC201]
MNKSNKFWLGLSYPMMAGAALAEPIVVDGKLNEAQWGSATQFEQFVQVVPVTLASANDKITAKAFATADGVYIGIKNFQNEAERKRQFNIHDRFMQADFNRVVVDFSGDGSSAYQFSVTLGGGSQDGVVTPSLNVDYDWDGDWHYANHIDDTYWTTELLIPWHTVSFQPGDEQGLTKIGVSVQLYELKSNFIYANHEDTTANSDFFLTMPKIAAQIPAHSQLAFVPYFAHQAQFAPLSTSPSERQHQSDVGFDLFYKPSHHQKVSLAVNPDFGQVDIDDVDVNYSAVETLRTDKRPFFTQDISLFDVAALESTKLIHTRRIGASSDDGTRAITPIDAALRFVHKGKSVQFGTFAVSESDFSDDIGKQFFATRANYRTQDWQVGVLATKTDRPFLERDAMSYALDGQYRSDTWSFKGALLQTEVETQKQHVTGQGVSLDAEYQLSLQTKFAARYFAVDDEFDNRDLGYMKRNDWQVSELYGEYSMHPKDSWFTRFKQSLTLRHEQNNAGTGLAARQAYLAQFLLANGGQLNLGLDYYTSGKQDNLGRGTEVFEMPSRIESRVFYQSPYVGDFSWAASIELDQEGISGSAQQYAVDLTWMPHYNWNLKLSNFFRSGDGWLMANGQNRLSEYDRDEFSNKLEFNGRITDNLELSGSLQWTILEAQSKTIYQITNGELHEIHGDTSFDDRRLASQIKLRYRMGAYSDIFLVYQRGGANFSTLEKSQVGRRDWFGSVADLWQQPVQDLVTFKVRYLF